MLKRILLFLLLCSIWVLPASGESAPKLMTRQTSAYFGTVSALFLYDSPENAGQLEQTWTQVKSILNDVERVVSVSIPDSDIARFNALPGGETTEISAVTADILQIAFAVHEETGGLYDPTVYPLIDLWGFSPRFNTNAYKPLLPYDRAYEAGKLPLPDDAHIAALLPLVGMRGIELIEKDGRFYLTKHTPSVTIGDAVIHAQLDLGGIAKGYACDLVKQLLTDHGYTMGHFICGDSSMAILSRPDGAYKLNLGKPRAGGNRDSHFATVTVANKALSTSSDSRHAYMHEGIRYCHIINPLTGYPINIPHDGKQKGAASITLLSASAARSDAFTTALCLMTPQEAVNFISEHLSGDSVIISLYASSGDTIEVMHNLGDDAITVSDPAYQVVSDTDASGNMVYAGSYFAD